MLSAVFQSIDLFFLLPVRFPAKLVLKATESRIERMVKNIVLLPKQKKNRILWIN